MKMPTPPTAWRANTSSTWIRELPLALHRARFLCLVCLCVWWTPAYSRLLILCSGNLFKLKLLNLRYNLWYLFCAGMNCPQNPFRVNCKTTLRVGNLAHLLKLLLGMLFGPPRVFWLASWGFCQMCGCGTVTSMNRWSKSCAGWERPQ